jgi:hypothetical protein
VGLPWNSLLAFLRLVTNPRVFEKPETMLDAWKQVEEWLDCETAWVPEPTERHREVLGSPLAGSDNLLVFYISGKTEWQRAVQRLESLGYRAVKASNRYWDKQGKTFEDPDGYRVVLQNASWPE